MKKKIVVCDKYTQEALTYLTTNLDCTVQRSLSRQPTVDEVKDCQALLIRSRTRVNERLIARAPHLEVIISATSGFDHIDLDACKANNIVVMHTPEANSDGAAQLTIMHILNWYRKAFLAHKAVVSHMWKEELPIGMEISGKNVGILGLGRVGRRVAALCKAFGAQVSAHDPYIPLEEFKKCDVQPLGFSELLRDSDIISLHTPLTSKTREVINKKTLELMNENTLLVNTARGKLINEQDLVEALENRVIAGAALDVFSKEPLPRDSELRMQENVICTPHIGAYTRESYQKASMQAVQKIINFFNNNEISDQLPPRADWLD